ncbi:MAG: cobalt ECF transporter T component CbiQ [Thermacetogeniaceae bacterium]
MADYQMPEWLLESQGPLPSFNGTRKVRRGFLEKTIDGFSQIMIDDFFAERIAGSRGLMQGLHPGIKVITTLLLIVMAVCLRTWPVLLLLNLWVLLLVYMSNIGLSNFLKRVWLVVPLFAGIIILPSLFNVVRPGDPLLVLLHFSGQHRFGPWVFPDTLAITRQGVRAGIIFVLRVGACVSLSVLLTLTTRWPALLKGLSMIRIPSLFTKILEMTYRYIYVLLQSASDMFLARKSRTVGRTNTKEQQQFVGSALGALWTRAFALSEEVHAAMIARGFNGIPRTLSSFKIEGLDWFWTGFTVLVSILLLWGDSIVGWR